MPSQVVAWNGEEAWRNVLARASSRWHAARRARHFAETAVSRLERAVVLPEVEPGFRFERGARLFTVGSCFARHIENYLLKHGWDVPSGHLDAPGLEEHVGRHATVALNKFTTHSMLNELRWALEPGDSPFPEGSLVEEGDGWVDLQLVGEVTPRPREVVLARRARVAEVFRRVRECHVAVITLGLVEAWYDHEHALYLNRAPGLRTVKRHAGRFELRLLDHALNLEALEHVHALLRRHGRADLRTVVSVSPVPLSETFTGRDVLVANAYSKATLRAAAEDFARRHADVEYFPSFESVTLSDRRVAFQDDLHHVADAIVDLNVRRFLALYGPAHEPDGGARALVEAAHVEQRLRRVQDDALAENARLRAEAAELRARIAALETEGEREVLARLRALDADGRVRDADGRRLPLAPRLAGSVEVGEARADGEIVVSGWALDLDAPQRSLLVVAFADGRPCAHAPASIARPDVAQALGLDAPLAGFQLAFDPPPGEPDPAVRVVAVDAHGRTGELTYHEPTYRLRRA